MAATLCCKCNGSNAKCKRCDCVKKGKPCVNCVPIRIGTCHNTVTLRQEGQAHGSRSPSTTCSTTQGTLPVSSPPSQSSFLSLPSLLKTPSGESSMQTSSQPETTDVDDLMLRAFGQCLDHSVGSNDVWYKRWLSIVKLSGRHYHLPGGSTGRKYIDQLTQELSHFSAGDYPSERFNSIFFLDTPVGSDCSQKSRHQKS